MVHFGIATTPNPDSKFSTFLVMNPRLSDSALYLEFYRKSTIMDDVKAR
jgi:hypothetical protein